jgi:nicotinamidase-related amidase
MTSRPEGSPLLTPEETLLVVIDVQERLLPHIHGHPELVRSIVRLVKGCQLVGVPVLATEQYTKGLGPTAPAVKEALGDAPLFEKMCFSCWEHGPFREALEASGRLKVLLCGIEAHVCVLQTALQLQAAGFRPQVVADAVSSRFPRNLELALARLQQEGIPLTSVETAVFELLEVCGTEPFRAWIRILKEEGPGS